MSNPEEIANSLCITEEAFEDFQKNTVYEESEYITLSDIVPQEKVQCDLTATLADLPSDELERSFIELNQSPSETVEIETSEIPQREDFVNDTLQPVQEFQCNDVVPETSNNRILEVLGFSDDMTLVEPKCNGSNKTKIRSKRKKKAVFDSNLDESFNDNLIQISSEFDEKPSSTKNVKRKRTSRKKALETPTPMKLESDVNKSQKNPPKKKRGRPKKIFGSSLSAKVEQDHKIDSSMNCDNRTSDDDGDDVCLSKFKQAVKEKDSLINQNTDVSTTDIDVKEPESEHADPPKEINDTLTNNEETESLNEIVKNENLTTDSMETSSLLVEDTSKRPNRRKSRKPLLYEEDSEEDPFANVELSDDEPQRKKKGKRYYSDDEYVPGKQESKEIPDSSDSDIDSQEGETKLKPKRRRYKKDDSFSKSPSKKENSQPIQPKVTTVVPNDDPEIVDDIEVCLQSSVIKASNGSETPSKAWGVSNEFENFIAKKIQGTELKIKKVSSSLDTVVAPLDIPVINPNEVKKMVQTSSQTKTIKTVSTGVQTSAPRGVIIKENKTLSSEQATNACEFLTSIVKTTAELGQLLTDKSQEFMKKKINTENIKDAQKIDYCVKKSFLLFKLAKSNLTQMEDDLAKQYEEFLDTNGLSSCKEEVKTVVSNPRPVQDDDSDCEIVETPGPSKSIKKTVEKFNPKTVFLNKELSIKIAKKPTPAPAPPPKPNQKSKFNAQGRHTVWINENIMVKKVKPTQSFLAQDSRNKKPPDSVFVTNKMVSDFFDKRRAVMTCAPYVSSDWLQGNCTPIICNYFFIPSDEVVSDHSNGKNKSTSDIIEYGEADSSTNTAMNPKSLLSLCTKSLQKHLHDSVKLREIVNNKCPQTLIEICVNYLNTKLRVHDEYDFTNNTENLHDNTDINLLVSPLKTLCHKELIKLMDTSSIQNNPHILENKCFSSEFPIYDTINEQCEYNTDCSEDIRNSDYIEDVNKNIITPKTLKLISLNSVKNILNSVDKLNLIEKRTNTKVRKLADICSEFVLKYFSDGPSEIETEMPILTINTVNTVSEEAYQDFDSAYDENEQYFENHNYDENHQSIGFEDFNENTESSNWESQVQMQEFRSCLTSSNTPLEIPNNSENIVTTNIKVEPVDEVSDAFVDCSFIKTEPGHHLNGMTIVPDSIVTKLESHEEISSLAQPVLERQDSGSFDEQTFEHFVSRNKMMHALNEPSDMDEIFSQSALRIRRQHRPDSDEENDYNMGLLVPQAFEPLSMDTAKDSLMESSDEGSIEKRPSGKKKVDKRYKNKSRNVDAKTTSKEPVKTLPNTSVKSKQPEKVMASNEVAVLTRKMKERIRQEEKKNESSDSDVENVSLSVRKDILTRKMKERIRQEEKKNESSDSDVENVSLSVRKDIDKKKNKKKDKAKEDEIQCSNVDSTEKYISSPNHLTNFTGFSALDQNEISSYEKYVKFVYNKILPSESDNSILPTTEKKSEEKNKEFVEDVNNGQSFKINADEPVEELECEPTLPIFDDTECKTKVKKNKNLKSISPKKTIETTPDVAPAYTDRHGWHCYAIDGKDSKLYQTTSVPLDKLPESFVQTYFEYQEMTDKDKEDDEVARLTNLQSLGRLSVRDGKTKGKKRVKTSDEARSNQTSETNSRSGSPLDHDNYAELTPSEDEGCRAEDETPPPLPLRESENNMAKDLLMDDNDSDGGGKSAVKTEPGSETSKNNSLKTSKQIKQEHDMSKLKIKIKIGPKSKCSIENSDSLMLTADKMMNKELHLLHAPVVLDETVPELPAKRSTSPKRHRSGTTRNRMRIRSDDDYSSEEEKQWVTTKEKLLKRMVNKQDTASLDDAKRAKLVSEFIERRGEGPTSRKRHVGGRRRSRKKLLEKQKQLRVLSKELFGESSGAGRKANSSYLSGRRNIRKVIDKKSLARSTVIANMEEFERKRRINARQAELRELLGCEEGVNVVVINDEVCLEYDFQMFQPIVTVHPFFTKVMKAHQYEGVKFMWDACFESLSQLESGQGGGGCILAHCMGLGKTLQVLALLHTVLTNPRAGMKRVLVCCPLSTVLNWVDEIHKWIGPVTKKIKVFELSKLKKTYERAFQLEDWYNGGGIFIIGYELFRSLSTLDPELDDIRPTIINKIRTALLDPGPDIIVCDEGHLLKNDCSVLAVAMSRVVTKRRIVLTGTPMQNNLREYYCMVNFVKPNLLGTYSEYSNRFENPIMNGQHRDSIQEDIKLMKARTHILHKVLEGCLQRQEASVLYPYLPKKHEYTVFVSMTKCQWDLYKHYMANYGKSKQNVLKDFHVLQKIWSHPQVLHSFHMKSRNPDKVKTEKLEDDLAREDLAYEDIKPGHTEVWWLEHLDGGNMLDCLTSSNKFDVIFRILKECVEIGDKVLIFSTSLITMDSLEYFLKKINKWSLGHDYYRLDGSVPAEVRQKWCREFNAENNVKTKLFLISTRAGCLGLNMTAANRVIILDTSWNPAHDIQSIFRVYRFGQKKDCYIYRLVALGTMEQKIYERSVTKQAVACRVVDEQQIDRHYNSADLTELYKFDESGKSVECGVACGVRDVVLLRVARHPALHAVHEHDSLLRGSAAEQALPESERNAVWHQFQQEQARKQEQNDLVAVEVENKNMKRLNLPAENQLSPKIVTVKTENTPIKTAPRPVVQYKPAPKSKKARNDDVIISNIPVQNSDHTFSKEDEAVKKITDILIRHNYKNRQGPKEISDLIARVRKIISTGEINQYSENNEMIQSIAKVLLEREGLTMTMPPLTDIREPTSILPTTENFCEALDNCSRIGPKKRGRGRPRKYINPPTTNTPTITINTISSETIEIDDDDEEATVSETETNSAAEAKKALKTKERQHNVVSELKNTVIESILLSDDDLQSVAPVKKEPSTSEDANIPLHPSLLTNKNFIKIVAHTYLHGNPMLDEDAATLAAQYSTLRALKEIESTGKQMRSGPIYDIAVNVLGLHVLQKLKSSGVKLQNAEGESEANALLTSEKPNEPLQSNSKAPSLTKKKAGPLRFKAKLAAQSLEKVQTIVSECQAKSQPANVVPVGLFKMSVAPAVPATPNSECILPDADDSPGPSSDPAPRIVSAPIPAACLVPPTDIKSINLTPHGGRSVKTPFIVRRVAAGPKAKTLDPVFPAPAAQTPVAAPESILSSICLDSDEEEAPAPLPPVPMLKAPAPPPPVSVLTAPAPAPPVPVLTPMTLTSGESFFVINTSQLSMMKSTSLLSAQPVTVAPAVVPVNSSPVMSLSPLTPMMSVPPLTLVKPLPPLTTSPSPTHRPAPKLSKPTVPKKDTPIVANSTKCKPGDIIRIGKNGKLEILNGPSTVEQTSSEPAAPKPTAPKLAAPKLVASKALPPTPSVAGGSGSRRRSRSSSSSSNEDSSNPLDILRDVVHIQAPDLPNYIKTKQTSKYPILNATLRKPNVVPNKNLKPQPNVLKPQTTTSRLQTTTSKPQPSTSKPQPSTSKPQPSTSKPQPSTSKPQSATSKNKITLSNINNRNIIKISGKQPTKKPACLTLKQLKALKLGSLSDSVDLTLLDETEKTPTSTMLNTNHDKNKMTQKVVGSAKNILLMGSKNIKIETIRKSSETAKLDAKKRAVTNVAPTPPVKKKKTEMTLKDFDIDDINDIIELE